MDRHDVSEAVTAENVAHLHQQDLKVQHKFGCRGLTYWFDDVRKTAFCLIEAPNEQTLNEMHDQAHGEVPNQIIEVDASIVESFLGRIEDPEKAQNTQLNIINDPAFRTLMVITFVNHSFKNYNSFPYLSMYQKITAHAAEIITWFEGNIVQQRDHVFLVSFKSVTKAVLCALKIRESFSENISENINDLPDLKIGLHAGVPVTEKKAIFEDTVKLAERMIYISKAVIAVSSEVQELYKSENLNEFFDEEQLYVLTSSEEDFLTRLMDFTEKEWQNTMLQVDDFHQFLGISKSQLYRKMMLLVGNSPNSFLQNYRLQKSLHLLSKHKQNISDVAYDCGFNSPSYFSKCFRKKFGIIPSEFSDEINF
jgi:AraC-like DNA-binding protein